MCQQNYITTHCPTCRHELSHRYEELIRCPNRYYCYVDRPHFQELAARECESCRQRSRERVLETRSRQRMRDLCDNADEDERDAARDEDRKGDRLRSEREREEGRNMVSRASRQERDRSRDARSGAGRQEREREREREPSPTRSWEGNKKRKHPDF